MATNDEVAREFVSEYLNRRPEWLDLVEYLDYEYPGEIDEHDEGWVHKIWDEVMGELDVVEQRYVSEDY